LIAILFSLVTVNTAPEDDLIERQGKLRGDDDLNYQIFIDICQAWGSYVMPEFVNHPMINLKNLIN